MNSKNQHANLNIIQVFIDVVSLILAFMTAKGIYFLLRGTTTDTEHIWMLCVYGAIYILTTTTLRMYNLTTFHYIDRIFRRNLLATILAAACVSTVIFLSKFTSASRLIFILFVSISFAFTFTSRLVIRFSRKSKIGFECNNVLFIGSDEMCDKYKEYMSKTALKVNVERKLDFDAQEISTEDNLQALLVKIKVNEVVIVHGTKGVPNFDANMALKVCEDMGITIRVLLDLYDLPESHYYLSSIGTLPILTYHSISLDRMQLFLKRCMDTIGALIGLIVFSPVFVITALAIKLESPGPIMFCQTRVGRNGKTFKMYKFRSMYKDAEARKAELQKQNKIKGGLMFKMDNDPRITRVGKFIRKTSIDELPQLINVLKREMSLVGTRPPTIDEVEKYDRHHHRRISITPGITGMWQVSGRSEILDFEQVVELDKKYIEEWSIMLDIKLIFKTVAAVVVRKGAV